MKHAMFLPGGSSEVLIDWAQKIEAAGFDSLWQAVIEEDLSTAYRIGAGAMMFSVWARIYDDIFAAHGFAETVEKVRAMQRTPERLKAIELIPPEMIEAFCAVGPIDRVRARVKEREGLLDTVILAVPATSTTREQQDYYRNKLLDAFAF